MYKGINNNMYKGINITFSTILEKINRLISILFHIEFLKSALFQALQIKVDEANST